MDKRSHKVHHYPAQKRGNLNGSSWHYEVAIPTVVYKVYQQKEDIGYMHNLHVHILS